MSLRVVIAGAGLGGLTLAHGLRSAGLDVSVFERDQRSADPTSGYRIHIDPTGSRALHACLPNGVWNLFTARSAAPPRGIAFATESLRQLAFIGESGPSRDPVARSHPISRAGLRQLLLTGLEDAVTFDKRLARYETKPDGEVVVYFADGSATATDVLVGADGSSSAVRKQLLPHARVVDTGVSGIAGKLYLTDQTRERVPRRLLDQMTMVLPARGMGMFVAAFQRQAGQYSARDLDLPEHLFWVLIGQPGALGLSRDTRREAAAELHRLALEKVERWHPVLAWLVRESDPGSLVAVPLRTAQPVAAWPSTRVTLLGDAIHTMTPLQGLGGNTALRDAAVLCHQLVEVDRGRAELVDAIHAYEAAMLDYGFEAVRRSAQVSDSVASTNIPARLAFRSVLQVADRLPALHRKLFERPASNLVFKAPSAVPI